MTWKAVPVFRRHKPIGLDTIIYPSGRQVSTVYDKATGRIQQVSGLLAGLTTNFASAVNYAAHGELQSFQSGNGNFEEHCFDTGRLQTTGVRFGPVGLTGSCANFNDLLNLRYSYGTSNNNNGNLRSQTITRPQGTQTQWYGYNALNRLTIAAENPSNPLNPICPDSAAAWCQQYGYDAFGNRWVPGSAKLPSTLETPNSASWYAPNNQIIGWGYDKGNLTRVGNLYTLGYDAENRQKTAAVARPGFKTSSISGRFCTRVVAGPLKLSEFETGTSRLWSHLSIFRRYHISPTQLFHGGWVAHLCPG